MTKGSNHISHWARVRLDSLNLKQILGVNLAGLAFAVAIVIPQTNEVMSAWEVTREVPDVIIGPEQSATQWPLKSFGFSQGFSYGHPGVDLTAPLGTPVYPITGGTVEWIQSQYYGYGKHVFIKQNDQIQSLYAHLSAITVRPGQHVEKTTKIGEVGHTGWATGDHLHMEIYLAGVPVNPREILPAIK